MNNYYTKSQVDSTAAAGQPIAPESEILSAGLVHQAGEETITGTKTFATAGTTVDNVTTNNTVVVNGSSITMNEVETDTSDAEPVVSTNPKITLNGATGAADFTGNTTIGGTLGVTGDTTLTGGLSVTGATILSATSGLQFGTGAGVQNVNGIATTIGTAGSGGTASNEKLATELAVANALTGYVSAVAEGTTNGTVAVTKNGTTTDVAVHGLGSAAYADTGAFATSAQGSLADSALQSVVINGTTLNQDSSSITLNGSNLALTSYTKGSSSADIAATDSINVAFGKVENRLDNINNNMFSKTNIKNSESPSSADTVYSTGYINTEFDYGNVENSTDGMYSGVKGINTEYLQTAAVRSFVPVGGDDAAAGKARGDSLKAAWSGSGDDWHNDNLTTLSKVVASATWNAQNKNTVLTEGTKNVTYTVNFSANSTPLANAGIDSNNMNESVYKEIKDSFVKIGDTNNYTNSYLSSVTINDGTTSTTITQFTGSQKLKMEKVLEQMIVTEKKLALFETEDNSWDKDHLTEAQKNALDKYFASVPATAEDITSYGASNDAIYKKFVEGDKTLHTINTEDTIAENMVRLDAVIGKIEGGAGQNVKPTQTIGENLKALDDTLGRRISGATYLDANTTATDAIVRLANYMGKYGSFDFSQKSIAQTLAEMPSVDQSNLVHTHGNERIYDKKYFEGQTYVNNQFTVGKKVKLVKRSMSRL